ncbi:MAG TPA: DUF222 domain-containing protein, partial [Pseudonocardiaceae bacterium]|jgi:Domain of unknown function (DUF222)
VFEGESVIAAMQHWERVIAHAQAEQLTTIAELVRLRRQPNGQFDEYVVDEIALALGISGVAAGYRLDLALDLTERLPATLAALHGGEIDLARARAIADAVGPLSAEHTTQVEARVLAKANDQTAPQLRQSLKRAVLRADPEGAQARHQQRRKDRQIVVTPAEDGMADLRAHLPAPAALAIYDTVNDRARRACTPGDERTADQRRADAFIDLVLGERTSGPVAQVTVTVPASTVLGIDQAPGELAGYGPIPAPMARELAADATWRRLLTDPASGTLLDYGRTTYKPPAGLADFVRARDLTCRFPGCTRPAEKCELDHRIEYPRGRTSAANLDALCPHHHHLKHQSIWRVDRLENGDNEWLSPAGIRYTRRAEPIAEPIPEYAQYAEPPPL